MTSTVMMTAWRARSCRARLQRRGLSLCRMGSRIHVRNERNSDLSHARREPQKMSTSTGTPAAVAPRRRDRTHYLYLAVIVAVLAGIVVGLVAPDTAVK